MNSLTGPAPNPAPNPAHRPKLLDGGLGTFLLKTRAQAPAEAAPVLGCTDTLNHSDPQAVIDAHTAFLAAGSRYLTTNTFCCDPLSLSASGYDIQTTSQRGAVLAVKARAAFEALHPTPQGCETIGIMGSLGPGWLSPEKGEISCQALIDTYARRAEGLIAGGVDGFVIETVQDLQQAEAALQGIEKALGRITQPVFITVSVSRQGQRIGRHRLQPAFNALRALAPTGLGFNCGEGPEQLEEALAALQGFQGAIWLKPNAGGGPQALRSPTAFAQTLWAYHSANISAGLPRITHWGGCCGASPAHIQAINALGRE